MGNLIKDNPIPQKHTEEELIALLEDDEERENYKNLLFKCAYEVLEKKGIKIGCVVELTKDIGPGVKGDKYKFTGLKFIHYMSSYGKGPLVMLLLINGENVLNPKYKGSSRARLGCKWNYLNYMKTI